MTSLNMKMKNLLERQEKQQAQQVNTLREIIKKIKKKFQEERSKYGIEIQGLILELRNLKIENNKIKTMMEQFFGYVPSTPTVTPETPEKPKIMKKRSVMDVNENPRKSPRLMGSKNNHKKSSRVHRTSRKSVKKLSFKK